MRSVRRGQGMGCLAGMAHGLPASASPRGREVYEHQIHVRSGVAREELCRFGAVLQYLGDGPPDFAALDSSGVFVLDLPQMTVSVTSEQAIRWGVTPEELEVISRTNLRETPPELEVRLVESREGGRAAHRSRILDEIRGLKSKIANADLAHAC